MKRDRIVFGVLVLAAIFMVLATSATATENRLLLDPDNSVSDGTPVQVAIYTDINETDKAMAASFDIVYDTNCIQDFPSFDTTGSGWPLYTNSTPASGLLRFTTSVGTSSPISGHVKVGTLTFTCNTTCCGSFLNFTGAKYTSPGGTIYPAVDNGTFLCDDPSDPIMTVTKKVWDGSAWVDAIGPLGSEWKDKDVKFNITVTAGCLDLSDVVVNDTMDVGLEYNDSAVPTEDSNTTHTANWTIGSLAAGTSQSIEFNATIAGYGTNCNTAAVTGTVTKLGVDVRKDEDACVTTMPPAGINVTKTVWNGSAWVKLINDAEIGDTYRFRVEVNNTGSPGMDVCTMTVWDELPDNLAYANNAKLQDHHGTWWDLTDPPSINDTANNTYGWIIDDYVTEPECLQPTYQKLVIEYNATVTDYGLGCNNVTAEGFCALAGQWVQNNDSACINVPKPDLNVSKITVNYDVPYLCDMAFGPTNHTGARTQCNNLSALIVNNGAAVVSPHEFDVTFVVTHIDSGAVVASCTVPDLTLAAGANMTVYCNDSWYPYALENYTIDVTVDPADDVIEADEGNNTLLRTVMPYIYGWKGDSHQDGRNITMLQNYTGTINLAYSKGNSAYVGSAALKTAQGIYLADWTPGDFPSIPAVDTTIKSARLYVYYNWDKTAGGNVSDYFTLKFNNYTLPRDAVYIDQKMPVQPDICCPVLPDYYHQQWPTATSYSTVCGSNYPYGMAAYDVTHKFKVGDTNRANLTSTYDVWYNKKTAINGMLLVVVYDNPDEPERVIWINEGYDMLDSGLTTYAKVGGSYIKGPMGITPEEATTYAPFTGAIGSDSSEASLTTVVMDGTTGDANSNNKGQSLYFNDQLIGKDYVWSGSVAINETNIPLNLLSATDNTAAFRSYGDGFNPTNAFLIVEKGGRMRVDPAHTIIQPQDQFWVNITLDAAPDADVYAYEYKLKYNTSVLYAEAQVEGDFLSSAGPTSVVHFVNDHTNGVLEFGVTLLGDACVNDSSGTVARIHFHATGSPGQTTNLDLYDVLIVDCDKNNVEVVGGDGEVEIWKNKPPVAVGTTKYRFNNAAEKYTCYADLCACQSYDPDNSTGVEYGDDLVYTVWHFGDGSSGTSEGAFDENCQKKHMYTSWNWTGGEDGHYTPFLASLTVTDDGDPQLSNTSWFEVTVYMGGDANGDGIVNVIDAAYVGKHWRETTGTPEECGPYWTDEQADKADLNNDRKVDLLDMAIVGANWGHTAWAS